MGPYNFSDALLKRGLALGNLTDFGCPNANSLKSMKPLQNLSGRAQGHEAEGGIAGDLYRGTDGW
jgi:hypothetical protein